MANRVKRILSYLVVFGAGLGLGTLGGYVLNDYTSRENPNTIQQIRQELEQQQQLDDFFDSLTVTPQEAQDTPSAP